MSTVHLKYTARPRLLPIYARGLFASRSGLGPDRALPAMHSEWWGFTIDRRHLKRFLGICRLGPSEAMPLVYPLVFAFPLHMSIIGHLEFPLLYIRMMQVRNHVIQHRPVELQEALDISAVIVGQRVAEKGLEMDMYTVLGTVDDPVWESLHTYYFPGDFGEPDSPSSLSQFPPLPPDYLEKAWRMPNGGGFCFGLMAGDYNPLHYLASYARFMGFQRDFAHSQLSLALCVQHLPAFRKDEPVRLDVAIKGPVYYGSNVTMNYSDQGQGYRFDLYCEDNPRPSLVGSLSTADPDLESIRRDLSGSWLAESDEDPGKVSQDALTVQSK